MSQGRLTQLLDHIEQAGNRLPHPTTLFIILCGVVLGVSWLCAVLGFGTLHPVTTERIEAVNLLNADGLRRILGEMVANFTGFAPLGTVLVAMLGLGICERSGLIGALLRKLVTGARPGTLTAMVVLTGVLSSIAADAGYVVLVPLAGILFLSAGRHPVAGIAAAFAGVSGGFSANLLLGPVDALLASLSTASAQIVQADYEVAITANYWFMIVSTFLITGLGTLVTERLVIPRLGVWEGQVAPESAAHKPTALSDQERRGLRAAGLVLVVLVGLILWLSVPAGAVLRNPDTGSLMNSPLIRGIVPLIFLVSALCGLAYGIVAGSIRSDRDFIEAMESTMATMAGYLVLMFFAAQFVAWFSWSNLGLIIAVKGSFGLQALELGTVPLMVLFILFIAFLNLFIGSSSAKWAVLGPVFVPMLLLAGIAPEITQAAYRIGDSSTNIITPLMPYFPLVVVYCQRYIRDTGIGTVTAMMLPYSVTFIILWTLFLLAYWTLGIPLGLQSSYTY